MSLSSKNQERNFIPPHQYIGGGGILATVFCGLVVVFIVIVSVMAIPAFRRYINPAFMFISWGAFFLLGLVLIFLAVKQKVERKLRKFLILTGAPAVGFFISVLLHNFLYALAVITKQIAILHYLMEALHIIFFFIAIPVCPLIFLVGLVGSIVLFVKKIKRKSVA